MSWCAISCIHSLVSPLPGCMFFIQSQYTTLQTIRAQFLNLLHILKWFLLCSYFLGSRLPSQHPHHSDSQWLFNWGSADRFFPQGTGTMWPICSCSQDEQVSPSCCLSCTLTGSLKASQLSAAAAVKLLSLSWSRNNGWISFFKKKLSSSVLKQKGLKKLTLLKNEL